MRLAASPARRSRSDTPYLWLRGSDLKMRMRQQNIEVLSPCPPPANSNLIFQNTLRAAS
jgi:hypothetical protein